MPRENLIAAFVFACGAGFLLSAALLQYLRERRKPIGALLGATALFCGSLTRFPSMQNQLFFWSVIALIGLTVVVALIELAVVIHRRHAVLPPVITSSPTVQH